MASNVNAWSLDISAHRDLQTLIHEMVDKHKFQEKDLYRIFARVQLHPEIVEAMRKPYEAKPWYLYRKLFVTDKSVADGVEFWRKNKLALGRAEEVYGVPASVIVAIVGIETRYGKRLGKFPVIDSLSTLVLQYPRRSKYFRGELKQFLLLARDEDLDPLTIVGSYAGAMGIPQFLASSYRSYAVDFNGDGRRDLLSQTEDAIGSVANYLAKHRWRKGEPVASKLGDANAGNVAVLVNKKLRPDNTVQKLRQQGVDLSGDLDDALKASVVELQGPDGAREFRVTFPNFYVITRYNQSIHYAMAVHELSRELERSVLTPSG